jgi:hypothetical protein
MTKKKHEEGGDAAADDESSSEATTKPMHAHVYKLASEPPYQAPEEARVRRLVEPLTTMRDGIEVVIEHPPGRAPLLSAVRTHVHDGEPRTSTVQRVSRPLASMSEPSPARLFGALTHEEVLGFFCVREGDERAAEVKAWHTRAKEARRDEMRRAGEIVDDEEGTKDDEEAPGTQGRDLQVRRVQGLPQGARQKGKEEGRKEVRREAKAEQPRRAEEGADRPAPGEERPSEGIEERGRDVVGEVQGSRLVGRGTHSRAVVTTGSRTRGRDGK